MKNIKMTNKKVLIKIKWKMISIDLSKEMFSYPCKSDRTLTKTLKPKLTGKCLTVKVETKS